MWKFLECLGAAALGASAWVGAQGDLDQDLPSTPQPGLWCQIELAVDPPDPPRLRIDKDTEHCGSTLEDPVLLVRGRAVQNAVVWIELPADFPRPPFDPEDIELLTSGCRFRPRIQAARVGSRLRVGSEDELTHNPHAWLEGRTVFNLTLLGPAHSFRRRLERSGVIRVDCDTHPWMRAYIHVFDHPYFAVTGADGRARIPTPPPGRHRLHVWHEVLGTQVRTIEVETARASSDETFEFELRDRRSQELRPLTLEPWPPDSAGTAGADGGARR